MKKERGTTLLLREIYQELESPDYNGDRLNKKDKNKIDSGEVRIVE